MDTSCVRWAGRGRDGTRRRGPFRRPRRRLDTNLVSLRRDRRVGRGNGHDFHGNGHDDRGRHATGATPGRGVGSPRRAVCRPGRGVASPRRRVRRLGHAGAGSSGYGGAFVRRAAGSERRGSRGGAAGAPAFAPYEHAHGQLMAPGGRLPADGHGRELSGGRGGYVSSTRPAAGRRPARRGSRGRELIVGLHLLESLVRSPQALAEVLLAAGGGADPGGQAGRGAQTGPVLPGGRGSGRGHRARGLSHGRGVVSRRDPFAERRSGETLRRGSAAGRRKRRTRRRGHVPFRRRRGTLRRGHFPGHGVPVPRRRCHFQGHRCHFQGHRGPFPRRRVPSRDGTRATRSGRLGRRGREAPSRPAPGVSVDWDARGRPEDGPAREWAAAARDEPRCPWKGPRRPGKGPRRPGKGPRCLWKWQRRHGKWQRRLGPGPRRLGTRQRRLGTGQGVRGHRRGGPCEGRGASGRTATDLGRPTR